MTDEARSSLAEAYHVLAAAALGDYVAGHASVRTAEGFWIKGPQWGLEEVTPERLQLLSHDGEPLVGSKPVHRESHIHAAVYRARIDVGAVVHVHAPNAVAMTLAGRTLIPSSFASCVFVPPKLPELDLPVELVETRDVGDRMARELGDRNALLLVGHGIVTAGPDLPTAIMHSVLLEDACRLQMLAGLHGDLRVYPDVDAVKRGALIPEIGMRRRYEYLARQLRRV